MLFTISVLVFVGWILITVALGIRDCVVWARETGTKQNFAGFITRSFRKQIPHFTPYPHFPEWEYGALWSDEASKEGHFGHPCRKCWRKDRLLSGPLEELMW